MIESGKYKEQIIQDLNILESEIHAKSKLGLLNLNIHIENLLKDILNIIFDYNLENLNNKKSNFSGIDLGDYKKSIAFQITSTKTSTKISKTLNQCIKHNIFSDFKRVVILIIGKKQKKYTLKLDEYIDFDYKKDIIDFDNLYRYINQLSLDKLKKINSVIKNELPKLNFDKVKSNIRTPELKISLSETFKIDLDYNELQVLLKEIKYTIKNRDDNCFSILINEKTFFYDRLKEISKKEKDLSVREEIIDINEIINVINDLEKEIYDKILILFKIDTYPISDSFDYLSDAVIEIIERLSYPHVLFEETIFKDYFKVNKKIQAKKFQGDIKYDIYKDHKSGRRLACSVYLTKEELIEQKNKIDYLCEINDKDFFSNRNYLFALQFEVFSFNLETLRYKVIPSFVDKFYDFRGEDYKFIDINDFNSWTDLTNYKVGLG